MKRLAASLLTMAMILSLVGCTNKETEETKKKKKAKKTTETETSETEDPSDTENSETDPTDPSETSTAPDPSLKVPGIDHDLDYLDLAFWSSEQGYGEMCAKVDDVLFTIDEHCDFIEVYDDKLQQTVSSIYMDETLECNELFDDCLLSFPDVLKSVDTSNYYEYWFQEIYSYTSVARADEQILSFAIRRSFSTGDTLENSVKCYNFSVAAGEEIPFDRVVLDREGFAQHVESYAKTNDSAQFIDYVNSIADLVRNGSDDEIRFLIYQDCIAFYYPVTDSYGRQWEYEMKVSVMDVCDCVDIGLFASTTPYFTLASDYNHRIAWDFDDDGVLDEVLVENASTSYDLDLQVSINGNICDLSLYNLDIYADGISESFMTYTGDDYYLYVECTSEDPVFNTLVFRLEGDVFVYTGTCGELDSYPYDADRCQIWERADFMGTGHFTKSCSLLTSTGLPQELDSYLEKTAYAVTNQEMTLGIFNQFGEPTGDTVTIPQDSTVKLLGLDSDYGLAYFLWVKGDGSEPVPFQMVTVQESSGGYDIYFDGMNIDDLFRGLIFFD
ncbi:MAG: hypothetical protein J6Y08_03145 [Clostridiales bacterium]|nr:hypothetical protein [Clostridiales bacterium]